MSGNKQNVVNIKQAATLIEASFGDAFTAGYVPDPVCLHGSPGLGKSAIIGQLAQRLGERLGKPVEVVDIRLSAMEAADVQGIPYVADAGYEMSHYRNGEETTYDAKEMFFSTPSWWPQDPNKFYILFLDEIKNAPPHVQHAAYRLILDRTVQNGTKLPDTCAIVAAGNLKSDKTGARELLPAAANRFGMHLEIDPKQAAESFLTYAVERRFNPSIIGFLSWSKKDIYNAPNDTEAAFTTPRSWEFVNRHLNNTALTADDSLLTVAVAGAIGSEIATKFMGFRRFYDELPDWSAIRKGTLKYQMPEGREEVKYAVSTSMAFEIMDALGRHGEKENGKEVDMTTDMDNLTTVLEQLPDEMKIIVMKTIKRDIKLVTKFRKFKAFQGQVTKILSKLKGVK